MSPKVLQEISTLWSSSCIRYQKNLIQMYVDMFGRRDTDHWLIFLEKQFGLSKKEDTGWPVEYISSSELDFHLEQLMTESA